MNPRKRVKAAWVTIGVCVLGWPLSMLTIAKHEPPFVLSLSWLAIIITAVDVLATSDVRKEVDDD